MRKMYSENQIKKMSGEVANQAIEAYKEELANEDFIYLVGSIAFVKSGVSRAYALNFKLPQGSYEYIADPNDELTISNLKLVATTFNFDEGLVNGIYGSLISLSLSASQRTVESISIVDGSETFTMDDIDGAYFQVLDKQENEIASYEY
ncbi:MAG: hypothetical protein J6S67_01170 [Methanobrevibacter sp.]|nr:hypothetical protein [Methanobrevibacter sp.]